MSFWRKIFFSFCLVAFSYAALWHIDDVLDLSHSLLNSQKNAALFSSVDPSSFPEKLSFCCVVSSIYKDYGVREGLVCVAFPRLSFALDAQYHPLMGNYRLSSAFSILQEERISAGIQIHYALSQIPGYDIRHAISCSAALRINPHPDWRIFISNRNFLDLSIDKEDSFLEPLLHAGLSYAPIGLFQIKGGLRKRASCDWQFYAGFSCLPLSVLQIGLQFDYPVSALRSVLHINISRWEFFSFVHLHPQLGLSFSSGLAYAL